MKKGIIYIGMLLLSWSVTMLQAQSMATVMNSQGAVMAEKSGKSVTLKKGDKVEAGSKITTKENGILALMLAPGANIMVAPNSSLDIIKLDTVQTNGLTRPQRVEIKIHSGSIVTDFAPGDKNANITVTSDLASFTSSGCTGRIKIGSFIVQILSGMGNVHFNNQNFNIITNQYFASDMQPYVGDLDPNIVTEIAQFMNNALGGYVAGLFGAGGFGVGGFGTPLPTFSVMGGSHGRINGLKPNTDSSVCSPPSRPECGGHHKKNHHFPSQ